MGMRRIMALAFGAVVGLTFGAQPSAAAPELVEAAGSPTDDAAGQQAAKDILRAYPKQAWRAKVQGRAVLNCHADAHFAPHGCVLRWDQPQGFGFGDAALKLAESTPPNPAVDMPAGDHIQVLEYRFCLDPPSITPNALLPLHWVVEPSLAHAPSEAEKAAVLSPEARALNALVIMNCRVALDGSLGGCESVMMSPPGAWAAVQPLIPLYKATPGRYDGQPRADQILQVNVRLGERPPLPAPPVMSSADTMCKYFRR